MRRTGTIGAMTRLSQALVFLGLAACATAGGGASDDVVGDDAPEIDADPSAPDARPPIDAADPIDASPMMVTLSQASSTMVVAGNTLVCSSNVNNVPEYTLQNHFYRVFKLSDFGITTTFTAERVDFAVESADTVANSQTVTVRLHTMTGTTLNNAALTLLYGQNVTVADGATTMAVTLTSPVVVPAGSTLVLELFAPGFTTAGNFFYPGSNAASETGPSYIRGDDCGIAEPVAYSTVGPDPVSLILSVTGTKP